MTSQGPRRTASDGEWAGRLTQAREFHESARNLVTLAESKSYNSAITLMVSAAIGYVDAEVNYGARSTTHDDAERLLTELDEFAAWVEGAL